MRVRTGTSGLGSRPAGNGEHHFCQVGQGDERVNALIVRFQSSASQGGQTFRTLLYGHAVLLRHYRDPDGACDHVLCIDNRRTLAFSIAACRLAKVVK